MEPARVSDLIDTTEMYLRTIYELEEEGIVPLRARIAERLPSRADGLADGRPDGARRAAHRHRRPAPRAHRPTAASKATRVMRKHRLAERLLIDVIGLEWEYVHDEACRWEHVMSEPGRAQAARDARPPDASRRTATRSRAWTSSAVPRTPTSSAPGVVAAARRADATAPGASCSSGGSASRCRPTSSSWAGCRGSASGPACGSCAADRATTCGSTTALGEVDVPRRPWRRTTSCVDALDVLASGRRRRVVTQM